jgi:hypothetical protein
VARIVADAAKTAKSAAVAASRVDAASSSSGQTASANSASQPQVSGQSKQVTFPPIDLRDPNNLVEQQTLQVLVQYPQAFNQGQLQRIAHAGMTHPAHQSILQALVAALTADADTWLGRVQQTAPEALQSQRLGLAAAQLPVASEDKILEYGRAVVAKALERALAREKAEALARLRRLDAISSPVEYAEVQTLLVTLERERRALMGD